MSAEQKEHSQMTCYWCGFVYGRESIRFIDGKAICTVITKERNCREEYYESTRPGRIDRHPNALIGAKRTA